MARLDLRVRALAVLVGLASVEKLSPVQLERLQRRTPTHNRLTDRVFGALAPGVEVVDTAADGPTEPRRVRVYRPADATGRSLPLVFNIHGGGYTIGSVEQCDWLCSNVAARVGVAVVSVDYRLAPAHPWPAAPEDCYAALADVVARHDEFGIDPARVAVMGDSAGGALSAVLTLMARDRSGPAIAFQALLYPSTDQTRSSLSAQQLTHAPILSRAEMDAFRAYYLQGQDPTHPYVSPLLADDHRGLPPALIQVAEHDPLRDDGLRYAAALRAAGVRARATTYVGMPHAFYTFPGVCRGASQALAELCAELDAAFARTPVH